MACIDLSVFAHILPIAFELTVLLTPNKYLFQKRKNVYNRPSAVIWLEFECSTLVKNWFVLDFYLDDSRVDELTGAPKFCIRGVKERFWKNRRLWNEPKGVLAVLFFPLDKKNSVFPKCYLSQEIFLTWSESSIFKISRSSPRNQIETIQTTKTHFRHRE